jgi:hypothetical protein
MLRISPQVIAPLSELYPVSAHVAEVYLPERPDREIMDFLR